MGIQFMVNLLIGYNHIAPIRMAPWAREGILNFHREISGWGGFVHDAQHGGGGFRSFRL
jgi:hypothetical protein